MLTLGNQASDMRSFIGTALRTFREGYSGKGRINQGFQTPTLERLITQRPVRPRSIPHTATTLNERRDGNDGWKEAATAVVFAQKYLPDRLRSDVRCTAYRSKGLA